MRQHEPKVPAREITLRFLAEPTAVNFHGKVHGGGIRFHRPLHIGDMVEIRARLIHTGHTTIHVAVDKDGNRWRSIPGSRSTKRSRSCRNTPRA